MWFESALEPERMVLVARLFALLVAVDRIWQMPKAASYGLHGFNTSHLPFLDDWLPLPRPGVIVALWGMQVVLAGRVAWGGASRPVTVALAALYGTTYFWSQLDRYQHHYLVFVVLVVLCCVDFRATRPPTWPGRLLMVQVALLYGWTAVAKMDPAWVDGTLPALFITGAGPRVVEGTAMIFAVAPSTIWGALGIGVIVVELVLAAAFVAGWRHFGLWAAAMLFHASFYFTGFAIEQFPLYMAVFLLFLLPRVPRLPEMPSLPVWAVWGAVTVVMVLIALLLPVRREYHATAGNEAWRATDEAGARASYREMLRLDPDYAAGWVQLADLEAEAGHWDEALAAVTQARLFASASDLDARHAYATAAVGGEPANPRAWYAAVCAAGDADACRRKVRLWTRGHLRDAELVEALAAHCDEGDGVACDELGDLQRRVRRKENLLRSAALEQQACTLGELKGCSDLAAMIATGSIVTKDPDKARDLYHRACAGGVTDACANLGWIYLKGVDTAPDRERASYYGRKACRAGSTLGCRVTEQVNP